MTEQDGAYRERVARVLADEIAGAYPLVAGSVPTIAKTIETRAEISLKMGRQWNAKEESQLRAAFSDVFGKPPTFGDGCDAPPSLAEEWRAYQNAAIEEALEYRKLVHGLDAAAKDAAAGNLTDQEFIARATRIHTDSLGHVEPAAETSAARNWLARRSQGRRTK